MDAHVQESEEYDKSLTRVFMKVLKVLKVLKVSNLLFRSWASSMYVVDPLSRPPKSNALRKGS
jgi:hypothetical protein